MRRLTQFIKWRKKWRKENQAKWHRFVKERPLVAALVVAIIVLGPFIAFFLLLNVMPSGGDTVYSLCTLGLLDGDPEISRLNERINSFRREAMGLSSVGREIDGTMLSGAMRLRYDDVMEGIEHLERQRRDLCRRYSNEDQRK